MALLLKFEIAPYGEHVDKPTSARKLRVNPSAIAAVCPHILNPEYTEIYVGCHSWVVKENIDSIDEQIDAWEKANKAK